MRLSVVGYFGIFFMNFPDTILENHQKKKKKKNSMEPSFRWPFWGIFAYFKPFWSNSWNSLIYSREILYKCTWYYAGS